MLWNGFLIIQGTTSSSNPSEATSLGQGQPSNETAELILFVIASWVCIVCGGPKDGDSSDSEMAFLGFLVGTLPSC